MVLTKCERAGHKDGNLIFEVSASDGTKHQFAMTTDCFMDVFGMGWKAADALPKAPQQGQAYELPSQASLAILHMKPGLVLMSGPLVISLQLDGQQIDYLQTEWHRLEGQLGEGPKH